MADIPAPDGHAVPRTFARTLTTLASSMLLLVMTALPALAASAGTKPDPEKYPYMVGSMEQLGTAAIVGVVVGLIAFAIMPKSKVDAADDHH